MQGTSVGEPLTSDTGQCGEHQGVIDQPGNDMWQCDVFNRTLSVSKNMHCWSGSLPVKDTWRHSLIIHVLTPGFSISWFLRESLEHMMSREAPENLSEIQLFIKHYIFSVSKICLQKRRLVIDVICRSIQWREGPFKCVQKSSTILHSHWLRGYSNAFVLLILSHREINQKHRFFV